MGRPRIPDPEKNCLHCSALLVRKRYGEQLEDMGRFRQRKFCDLRCMGLHKTKPPTVKHRIYCQASKAIPLKANCERCGGTARLGRHHLNQNPTDNRPENVQTLCASCHTKWHWEHGKPKRSKARCSVCGRPAARRGLCQKHWFRFAKYGDPLLTKYGNKYGSKLVRVSPGD